MAVHRRFVFALIISSGLIFTGSRRGDSSVDQPVQFNHQYHIQEEELECSYCHVRVTDYRRASIPGISICADCHEDMETDLEEAQKVVEHIAENREIPWIQIHTVPDHAYFSHQRHVKLGELECSVCHGNVAEKTVPFTSSYQEMTMDWCRDCHRNNLVTLDCNSCHR